MNNKGIEVDLAKIVGRGYKQFWENRKRFLVCKGSKGSKKSTTAAFKLIVNIMQHKDGNALVIRRFGSNLMDSVFSQIQWAINKLGVGSMWKSSKNPMQFTYKPTGQVILLKGMDDPQKLASITVPVGHLCWVWIEEAFQISNEEDFEKLDLSIRGKLPPHLWKEIIITFNPWSSAHWLKRRFFDNPDSDTLAMTTTYRVNEWLDDTDIRQIERLKEISPRRYNIIGNGDWGIAEGLIFDNWREEEFNFNQLMNMRSANNIQVYTDHYGLDFGYSSAPSAAVQVAADGDNKKLYINDELYIYGATNGTIYENLKIRGWDRERIVADSAEPKSIQELKELGVTNIKRAVKGNDSVRAGISKLQDYEIIVHPRCVNSIIEFSNYAWEINESGKITNNPIDDFNHAIDAVRYLIFSVNHENFGF